MASRGAVIFLHGSGDSGAGVHAWVETLLPEWFSTMEQKGIETIFPDAVPRPYSLWGNEVGSVWHNRVALDPSSKEETCEGINESANAINEIVAGLVSNGVAASRIFIGGFSQGGGMALYSAFHSEHIVGGAFALSSFLADDSSVYQKLAEDASLRMRFPVVMCHGDEDNMVRVGYGEQTCKKLKEAGVQTQWQAYSQLAHQLRKDELSFLLQWICSIVDSG